MKTKTIFKYFALFIAIGMMSCGSDDDSGNGSGSNGTATATSIVLNASTATANNVTTLFEGESVTFTTTDDLGNNVTGDVVVTVNGAVVTANPYTFTTAGTYVVVVTYGDLTTTTTVVVSEVPVPTSISLTANVYTCNMGEAVTFTVTDDLGNDVTGISALSIAGVAITNPHTFTDAGVIAVTAEFSGLSTSENITVIAPSTIVLTSDIASCWVDESATFTVVDNFGNDVTALADVTVGGVSIAANPHAFTAAGSFDVVATYYGLTSNTVVVIAVQSTHTTKVMVEDYTGTWCGYCPRLAYKIDQLALNNANVIPVAVHDDTPFGFPNVNTMINSFGIDGFPTGKISRTITWNETDAQVLSVLDDNKSCGLAIDSSISGATLSVTAKVHYDIDAGEEHKLVVYVLEDGLHYDQANYMNNEAGSPWNGAGNPIPNFEHENVARVALTNILGDVIPAGDTVLGSTYTKDFTYTIPAAYVTANLELVACVVDASGTVVNVQKVDAGSNQAFD